MRYFNQLLILILFSYTSIVSANNSCSRPDPLKELQAAAQEISCCQTGTETKNVGKNIFGLMGMGVSALMEKSRNALEKEKNDKSKCQGNCTQKNEALLVVNIKPTTKDKVISCNLKKTFPVLTKNFKTTGFDCKKTVAEEAEYWINDILVKDLHEGVQMVKERPSPCSYTSTQITDYKYNNDECTGQVRLTVICGDPYEKKEWEMQTAIRNHWKCEAPSGGTK